MSFLPVKLSFIGFVLFMVLANKIAGSKPKFS
jgi:hypothetical protein